MLHKKERHFQPRVVTLEALVPEDNFYRKVEAMLDLSFVRDLVRDCYSFRMGRPSVDPVVFFKLQLIMFFEGIRSERQLMEMVNMRLDHRWYIGYDLNEKVPDHSALSKIRDRYGLEMFQQFFEQIVELCIEAGLVWGKELYFDASQVEANASMDSLVPRVDLHLAAQFNPEPLAFPEPGVIPASPSAPARPVQNLAERYTGKRLAGRYRPTSYRRLTDDKISTTDPDAAPMKPGFAGYARLGYHTHYVVDGGKARIILAALVTPASVMDNTPMLDLERWVRFRWWLHPEIAVADSKYGTIYNLVGLKQDGLRAYMPPHNQERQKHDPLYPSSHFRYDAQHDHYLCPQGQVLSFKYAVATTQVSIYQAKKRVCDDCPVQTQCRRGKYGRSITRSFFQEDVERVEGYQATAAYQKAMRKRQVWIEPLFGEAKQWHTMRKFRLHGLVKVNIQGLLTAAGQNIKRLLQARSWKHHPDPGNVAAIRVSLPLHLVR